MSHLNSLWLLLHIILFVILQVIDNLLISHLEFRIEENMDVKPYVFQRNITTVVVPLGEKLQQIKDDYLQVGVK